MIVKKLKLKKESRSGSEKTKQTTKATSHFHSFRKAITIAAKTKTNKSGKKNKPKTLKNIKTLGVKCAEIYDNK